MERDIGRDREGWRGKGEGKKGRRGRRGGRSRQRRGWIDPWNN